MSFMGWVICAMIAVIVVTIILAVWFVRMGSSIVRHPAPLIGITAALLAILFGAATLQSPLTEGEIVSMPDMLIVGVPALLAVGLMAKQCYDCLAVRRWLRSRD